MLPTLTRLSRVDACARLMPRPRAMSVASANSFWLLVTLPVVRTRAVNAPVSSTPLNPDMRDSDSTVRSMRPRTSSLSLPTVRSCAPSLACAASFVIAASVALCIPARNTPPMTPPAIMATFEKLLKCWPAVCPLLPRRSESRATLLKARSSWPVEALKITSSLRLMLATVGHLSHVLAQRGQLLSCEILYLPRKNSVVPQEGWAPPSTWIVGLFGCSRAAASAASVGVASSSSSGSTVMSPKSSPMS